MKKVKRYIYLYEFETMSYRERFYYLRKNELNVKFPDININPLKWCLLDVIKVCYVPVLYLVLAPLLVLLCANEARHLKTRYADNKDKNSTFIEGWVRGANK